MWDDSLVITKYITPPYPALFNTLEKICKCTPKFVALTIWWFLKFATPFKPILLTCLISVVLQVGCKYVKMYYQWDWQYKKCQEQLFVRNNAHEDITENLSAQLEELDSIQKSKHLEKHAKSIHGYCRIRLMLHTRNLLLRADKYWPLHTSGAI